LTPNLNQFNNHLNKDSDASGPPKEPPKDGQLS
jgi:hypothetical protein